MLYALVGGVNVVADRCADSGQLAGCDRGTYAGTADEDSPLGIAAENGLADLACLIRIVESDGVGVGSQVDHGVPGEGLEHGVTEANAPVVECDRHLHGWTVPHRHRTTPGS